MQKPKQLQTALIRCFAPLQDRSQQAVDTLGQHTPTPGSSQHRTDCFPGYPHLLRPNQCYSCLQALLPQAVAPGLLDPGDRMTACIGVELPDSGQRLDSGLSPAPYQSLQCLCQYPLVAEQRL